MDTPDGQRLLLQINQNVIDAKAETAATKTEVMALRADLASHVADDKVTAGKVDTLMTAHQTQRGAMKVIHSLYVVASAVISAVVTGYFTGKH